MTIQTPLSSNFDGLAQRARRVLEKNAYFRARTRTLVISERDGVLTICGVLPSYYLRQVLDNVLCNVEGVQQIIDEVEVVNSQGLSSAPQQSR